MPKINREEYENKGFHNKNLGIWVGSDESEETEVKDIEWLKEKIIKHGSERGSQIATMKVLRLIDQLDEPKITIELAHDKIREESPLTEKSFDYYWNCIADDVEMDEQELELEIDYFQAINVISKSYPNLSKADIMEQIADMDKYGGKITYIEKPVIPQFVADYIKWFKHDFEHDFTVDRDYITGLVEVNYEYNDFERVKKWGDKSGNAAKMVDAFRYGFTVEEKPKYYALIKGHENIGSGDKYWNFEISTEEMDIGDYKVHPDVLAEYVLKATKEEWENLGVNDDNADFEEAEEVEE